MEVRSRWRPGRSSESPRSVAVTVALAAGAPVHETAEGRRLPAFLNALRAVVPESLCDHPHCSGVVVGDRLGDGPRGLRDAGDETGIAGRRRVKRPARERDIGRVGGPEGLAEAVRTTPRSEETEGDTRLGERGVGGGDPEVTGEGEFDAPAPGRAVDARDDGSVGRRERPGDPLTEASEANCAATVESIDDIEVRAGTERAPGAVQVHDVGVSVCDGGRECLETGRRQGVSSGRSSERDLADAGVLGALYHVLTRPAVSKGLCVSRTYPKSMDEVATCRTAAHDAVRDIEPDELRAVMDDLLSGTSMVPGVLALRAARAADTADGDAALVVDVEAEGRLATGVGSNGTTPAVPDHVAERAAGVQLIYEGLRLIRQLASDDPWSPTTTGETTTVGDSTEQNLAVLAADVLVSRGFYLLARTTAADKAVETVRNFGRDQTLARGDRSSSGDEPDRDRPGDGRRDRGLEADVLQLALIAGAAGTPGVDPTPAALSVVASLGRSADDGFPPVESTLAAVRVGVRGGAGVESAESATRPSATDS